MKCEYRLLTKRGGDLPDEPERDKVVSNELIVVLTRFFETEEKDDELLAPVSRMHEIVTFQIGYHLPVGVAYEYGSEGKDKAGKYDGDLSKNAPSDTSMLANGT